MGESIPSSIYKEYNKTMGKGVREWRESVFSVYIEYIIKRTCGKGKKGAER